MLFSCSVMSYTLWPHGLHHARIPCPSLSPRVCSNSCPLSWWRHPTISSSITHSPHALNLPASGSFPVSWLFPSDGQSIGALASASVLPVNIQGWFPLGLTGLCFLLSKGLSRVFSRTSVWKHKIFGTQPSLWSNSQIYTWQVEKPYLWLYGPLSPNDVFFFNMLFRFVIAFFPRNKCLLILWLQSPFTVILVAPKIKSVTVAISSPSACLEVMGLDDVILVFLMLSFKSAFSFCSFTFIKRHFSSFSLSTIRLVLSAYLELLIFLLAFLISSCDSSSLASFMKYSAYKLNKQGDNIQPWCTPFPILDPSVVSYLVLTVASWPAYRFLRRQVRLSGTPTF